MKTHNDLKELNYNDLSFFTGKPVLDCKWMIAEILKIDEVTAKGYPKVKISETVSKDKVDFTMRSNSLLDGENQFEYLCNHYNKGTTINNLFNFSESKTFIKKIKFTGKHSVLNEILHPEQLLKLQKTWLLKNLGKYRNNVLTDDAYKFIKKHEWAKDYVKDHGVDIENLIEKYEKPLAQNV